MSRSRRRCAWTLWLTLSLLPVGAGRVEARAATPSQPAASGRVDIGGGRRLYYECRGTGTPTVVLESGLRNTAEAWKVTFDPPRGSVMDGVAGFTRVCAYDRPGTTWGVVERSRSDPVPMPRTARDAADDLRALLRTIPVRGPVVLVGHSTGGLIARLFARTHPGRVVGMVLVDAISERVQTLMTRAQFRLYDKVLLTRPPPALKGYRDLETIDFVTSFDQMRDAEASRRHCWVPTTVISKGLPFDLGGVAGLPSGFPGVVERAWRGNQRYMVGLTDGTRHVVARRSSHYVQLSQPALVVDAIRDVVKDAGPRFKTCQGPPLG